MEGAASARGRRGTRNARLAWGAALICAVAGVGSLAMLALGRMPLGSPTTTVVPAALASLMLGGLGALVASRHPRNPVGWLMLGAALSDAAYLATGFVAVQGVTAGAPAGGSIRWVAWVWNWVQLPALAFAIVSFLVFPDGRLLGRRWRPVVWAGALGTSVITIFQALDPAPILLSSRLPATPNPVGIRAFHGFIAGTGAIGLVWLVPAVLMVAVVASLVIRLRRSRGMEHQQVKLVVYVVTVTMTVLAVSMAVATAFAVGGQPNPSGLLGRIGNALIQVGFNYLLTIAVPASMALAILRYRLYDIDLVINKTLVYGSLAAFITAVYVAIVVGIGALAGQGSRPNLALSILATAVVAVAFQPVRERVQRLANRLVYGQRATPYEVLSRFASRMGGAIATEDLLPHMARTLAEGTGAARTDVWLRVGGEFRDEASWPPESPPGAPLAVRGEALPAIAGDLVLPVLHDGELLGGISLRKRPGEALTPTEAKLAADLASQAGLVLRNVRLADELLERLEELRASRQRLVAAQDEERRRLERNIHDGAQQQLVALAIKANLARAMVGRDQAKAGELLDQLKQETTEALENLRDLARGIYPPLLADKGLPAALRAQARKSPVPVDVSVDGVTRYVQDVEAAVYFCTLEALQNIAKYAGATRAEVRLAQSDGHLAFEVADDGCGFDPSAIPSGSGTQNMIDRLAALGGSVEIRSAPGLGTTVVGRVPV